MITKRRCPHTGIVNFFSHSDPLLAVGSVSQLASPAHTSGDPTLMIASPALPPIARSPKRVCETPLRAAQTPNRTGFSATQCNEPGGGALSARPEEPAIPAIRARSVPIAS